MLNKERFFRFGLDLQLEEVDRPKDMGVWSGEPGFVEENLETVLSFNLETLLPDEEWMLIGRQESASPDADLTAVSKACDLVFFEVKSGTAQPGILEQGLRYLIQAQPLGYPHYVSRYLRLQCYRDYKEANRLLGLAKGGGFDQSGPVLEKNLRVLRENNDTPKPDDEFLSLARDLLDQHGCPPVTVLADPEEALAGAFRSKFGFEGDRLLQACLGQSVNLAFVAGDFSEKVLNRLGDLCEEGIFFYLIEGQALSRNV